MYYTSETFDLINKIRYQIEKLWHLPTSSTWLCAFKKKKKEKKKKMTT